jgi:hypothetical protein
MTLSLKAAAGALGGVVDGGKVRFPAPGHSAKDRSATLWLNSTDLDGSAFTALPRIGRSSEIMSANASAFPNGGRESGVGRSSSRNQHARQMMR